MSAGPVNKTCVITGASSGIGLATARALAEQGLSLILVCRTRDRGEAAVQHVRKGLPESLRVQLLLADLAEQDEVRRVAAEIRRDHPALQILINNVGAVYSEMGRTRDGVERQHAVNCVNQFLLTRLLLPALVRGSVPGDPSRIICVCSLAHRKAVWKPQLFEGLGRYVSLRTYRHSKLAQALFAVELSRRLSPTLVTVNSVCPGYVATEIGTKHARGISAIAWRFASRFFLTPEEGARTPVHVATSPSVRAITGQFFEELQPTGYSPAALQPVPAEQLWVACCRATGFSEQLTSEELGNDSTAA